MSALHLLFPEDFRSLTGLVTFLSLSFFESLRLLTEISLCTRMLLLLLDLLAPTSFQCCFLAICLNGLCSSFHALVLQCFLPSGWHFILHYTQTQTTIIHKCAKYTLMHYMYTNKLNKPITTQLFMVRSLTDYRNHYRNRYSGQCIWDWCLSLDSSIFRQVLISCPVFIYRLYYVASSEIFKLSLLNRNYVTEKEHWKAGRWASQFPRDKLAYRNRPILRSR